MPKKQTRNGNSHTDGEVGIYNSKSGLFDVLPTHGGRSTIPFLRQGSGEIEAENLDRGQAVPASRSIYDKTPKG